MKKTLCLVLFLAILYPLTSCKKAEQKEPLQYIPNNQVEIAVAFIYDSKCNIATRPVGGVDLNSFTLACLYFDADGKQIESMKIIDCEITEPKNLTLWQSACPETAVYMDCAVYSTTDSAGHTKQAENIDLWEQSVVESFEPATYQEELEEALQESATLAVNNEYVTIGAVSWQEQSVTVEMELNATNIQSVYLFALWFDAQGQPVEIQACSYCGNGESMVAHIQATDNHNYIFQAPESAQSAKLIIQSVNFDGSPQWFNPYFYEWMLLNSTSAK